MQVHDLYYVNVMNDMNMLFTIFEPLFRGERITDGDIDALEKREIFEECTLEDLGYPNLFGLFSELAEDGSLCTGSRVSRAISTTHECMLGYEDFFYLEGLYDPSKYEEEDRHLEGKVLADHLDDLRRHHSVL